MNIRIILWIMKSKLGEKRCFIHHNVLTNILGLALHAPIKLKNENCKIIRKANCFDDYFFNKFEKF